ncbi:Derepression protein [Enterobacter ludwigii]|uniref:Derepression protein n=1 Tax=Enterobacter ludwigii TaxID=299767 RepID=UPI000DE270B5|nr:Derepression protein [Enterobacter ludwigii]RBO20143.1 Derepression protein [Enterobacter ludwigii]
MRNSTQTISACRDDLNAISEHLSPESFHKLNRASAMSHFVGLDLGQRELNGMHQLCMPHIFSYLHDDICFVLEELKAKGLCRDFISPSSMNGGEHHV